MYLLLLISIHLTLIIETLAYADRRAIQKSHAFIYHVLVLLRFIFLLKRLILNILILSNVIDILDDITHKYL